MIIDFPYKEEKLKTEIFLDFRNQNQKKFGLFQHNVQFEENKRFYNINVGVERLKIMEKIDLNNEKCDSIKNTLRYIWIDLIDQNPQKTSEEQRRESDLHLPSFGAITESADNFFEPKKEEKAAFKILLPEEDENTFKYKRIRSKTDNRNSTKLQQ
jgi:hypothetical protein